MKKKLLSIAMALLLAAAPLSVIASADGDAAAEEQGVKGTIKFNMGEWNHSDKVCFYVWAKNAAGETRHFLKGGWQDGDNWGSKKIVGTPVEGEDGIVESYEIEFFDGWDYFVIFNDKDTNEQTYDCIFNANAIGQTAFMTGNLIENPVDSEKKCIEADFNNVDGCGAYLQITSTGNIVGHAKGVNDNGAAKIAQFIYDKVGEVDKSGEECCTKEKVAQALAAFGTTAAEVKKEFQKFADKEDFAEKAAKAALLFGQTEDNPPVQTPDVPDTDTNSDVPDTDTNSDVPDTDTSTEPESVKGTFFFDMGDWDHSHKLCFYVWAKNAAGETRHFYNGGWQDGDNWASKKIVGTPVDGQDGIVESYEIEFADGWDYFVIFNDKDSGDQTYDCVLTKDAIGKTARMTGKLIENPVDSEKKCIEADFEGVDSCGPYLQITSTGNIVGNAKASLDNGANKVATYVFKQIGMTDKSGEQCVTVEKVMAAIQAFGTTPDEVIAEAPKFANEEGFAEKVEAVKKLFGVCDDNPPVQTPDEPVQTPDEPVQTPDVPAPQSVKGTFFFDMGDWDHSHKVCFYIWAQNAAGETRHFYNGGWQDGDNWGSKKIVGTPVEGQDGIVESYEVEFVDGWVYFVIFSDKDGGGQTYDCVITKDAIGKTARMTGEILENPVDSEQTCVDADFEGVDSCGPHLVITSTGNIVGKTLTAFDNGPKLVAAYVFKLIGVQDKSGVDCVTVEKVKNAMDAFKTNPDEVWAEFETFADQEGYAEKKDPSHDVIFGEAKPAQQLGDVDGDGRVTAKDAMLIQRYTINLTTLTDEQLAAADVDGDGKVTGKDALIIMRATVNLVKIPPERSGFAA